MAEKTSRRLDRGAAADLWRHTLAQIPSVFGRLVYLAALRDSNSGAYAHHGLAAVFGDEEASQAIRESHQETFGAWLEFGLEQQKADLEIYVAGLEPSRKKVAETWSKLEPYRNLPPDSARPVEKDLFLADLEALLSLLRNEPDAGAPAPDASPHP
ncbi:MAG: hypothetical protein HY235_28645 [Acidobacteria bacterium]|nr:hypothetical protein [Acidobacteriota bacterium]